MYNYNVTLLCVPLLHPTSGCSYEVPRRILAGALSTEVILDLSLHDFSIY